MRANLLWHLPKNNTQKHCLTLYYFFALTFFRSPQLELISQSKIIQMKSNEIAFKSNPIYLIKFDFGLLSEKKNRSRQIKLYSMEIILWQVIFISFIQKHEFH